MGSYLKMTTQQQIESLLELGWAHRRIARELGVHRETVGRYARLREPKPANAMAGSEDSEEEEVGPDQNRPNPITGPPSAAEAHSDYIKEGLKKGLTAQRIWQDLVELHGYGHGYLTVQRYTRRLKGRHPEVADHMEHPPGDEGQIDFFKSKAPVRDPRTGRRTYPWVFRMTLNCSRHGYEEALPDQKAPSFMRAHEHAFFALGGVPRLVRMDNTRTAVTRACLYDPDINDLYEAFAQHWGFIALPSRPHHPQEQGVQERSGGYVNDNALKGRAFESLGELNEFLRRWNRRVAPLPPSRRNRPAAGPQLSHSRTPAARHQAQHPFVRAGRQGPPGRGALTAGLCVALSASFSEPTRLAARFRADRAAGALDEDPAARLSARCQEHNRTAHSGGWF